MSRSWPGLLRVSLASPVTDLVACGEVWLGKSAIKRRGHHMATEVALEEIVHETQVGDLGNQLRFIEIL